MNEMHRPILPKHARLPSPPDDLSIERPDPPPDTIGIQRGDWIRRFFAANPFYLASVVLLLYGIHRVSADGGLFTSEVRQLFFNFSALQAYELAAVALAVFLARRRVWYDSTLLALLENLVLVVPFILVTQASLINHAWIWGCCAVGIGLAVVRMGVLKRFLPGLNLPWPLLGIGGLLLVVNAAWPVIYRELQEERMGKTITSGPAYAMNEWSWLVILPLLIASAAFLPSPRPTGARWPQRRWLPLAVLGMWLVASTVHLYALSYVYTFAMRPAQWAPVVVVLAWTLCRRLPDWLERLSVGWQWVIIVNPFLWMFLAFDPGDHHVLLALAGLNTALYGLAAGRRESRTLAIQLAMACAITAFAVLPHVAGLDVLALEFARIGCGGAIAGYAVAGSLFSRRPIVGSLGAVAAAILTGLVVTRPAGEGHWMLHVGLAFLLLHSLRWGDEPRVAFSALRWAVALAWVGQSLAWAGSQGSAVLLASTGASMVLIWLAVYGLRHQRPPLPLPVAGALVMGSGPVMQMAAVVRNAPGGVMAVVASFVLLAVGTAAALTKHRWHRVADE